MPIEMPKNNFPIFVIKSEFSDLFRDILISVNLYYEESDSEDGSIRFTVKCSDEEIFRILKETPSYVHRYKAVLD